MRNSIQGPSVSVSGPGALVAMLFMMTFGAVMTAGYLLVITFVMNLFGISIPVN